MDSTIIIITNPVNALGSLILDGTKKAKLFGYGFGSIFLVIGIVCIMSLF